MIVWFIFHREVYLESEKEAFVKHNLATASVIWDFVEKQCRDMCMFHRRFDCVQRYWYAWAIVRLTLFGSFGGCCFTHSGAGRLGCNEHNGAQRMNTWTGVCDCVVELFGICELQFIGWGFDFECAWMVNARKLIEIRPVNGVNESRLHWDVLNCLSGITHTQRRVA